MPGVLANVRAKACQVWTFSVMWTLGVRGQFASADGVHRAKPLVGDRLCHRLRHHLRRRQQRMTPVGCAFQEFRMQFPRPCVAPNIRIVGIATFVDTVESSLNRIACETASIERSQRACGPADSHVGPLIRTLRGRHQMGGIAALGARHAADTPWRGF